jgi:hypothetical protein
MRQHGVDVTSRRAVIEDPEAQPHGARHPDGREPGEAATLDLLLQRALRPIEAPPIGGASSAPRPT